MDNEIRIEFYFLIIWLNYFYYQLISHIDGKRWFLNILVLKFFYYLCFDCKILQFFAFFYYMR